MINLCFFFMDEKQLKSLIEQLLSDTDSFITYQHCHKKKPTCFGQLG